MGEGEDQELREMFHDEQEEMEEPFPSEGNRRMRWKEWWRFPALAPRIRRGSAAALPAAFIQRIQGIMANEELDQPPRRSSRPKSGTFPYERACWTTLPRFEPARVLALWALGRLQRRFRLLGDRLHRRILRRRLHPRRLRRRLHLPGH